MTAFVIGFLVAIIGYWQGRCGERARCARRNAEILRQRDRQFDEIIRERDRLYNEAIWQRDLRNTELQRECERLRRA